MGTTASAPSTKTTRPSARMPSPNGPQRAKTKPKTMMATPTTSQTGPSNGRLALAASPSCSVSTTASAGSAVSSRQKLSSRHVEMPSRVVAAAATLPAPHDRSVSSACPLDWGRNRMATT